MKLTPELASKYAAYRERFLGGSLGTYGGYVFPVREDDPDCTPRPDPCPDATGRRYLAGDPAPFMVIAGQASSDVGTFLHVDRFDVCSNCHKEPESRCNDQAAKDPQLMESASILGVHFGDNTVYSSVALLCFAAEHAITGQSQPLELAIGIAESWQRLGSHQRGRGEEGDAPFGFILRSDSRDDAKADENFCTFEDGVGPAAFLLAPSFDQYAGILSHSCLAVRLLDSLGEDSQFSDLRQRLRAILVERVNRIVEFISLRTTYTLRWDAGGEVRQTEDDRGPYCHFAAYPFAAIAAQVVDGDISHFDRYLGSLFLAQVRDVTTALLPHISEGLRKLADKLRDQFVTQVQGAIGASLYELIAKFCDVSAIIIDRFDATVRPFVDEFILDPILQKLAVWDKNPDNQSINVLFAQDWFNLFVTGVLLDTSDAPLFQDSRFTIPLDGLFKWIGTVALPNSLPVNADLEFEAQKPDWWNDTIMGPWPNPGPWSFNIPTFDIDVPGLLQVPISIPFTGLMRKLVATGKGKAYLKFHAYCLLAAANLFEGGLEGGVPDARARELAFKYDNSWFMALAHRFHGASDDQNGVATTLKILESAPDSFPKGRASGQWNQDFRWIRDVEDKNEGALYSGLDFMAPLMVACSRASDLAVNRDVLVDALSPKLKDLETMGPFTLPFQGPIANQSLFIPHAGGTQNDTTLYVGVVFERAVGNGVVTLRIPTLDGGSADVEFRQDRRCSSVIAVPLMESGIEILSASATAKGVVVLSVGE